MSLSQDLCSHGVLCFSRIAVSLGRLALHCSLLHPLLCRVCLQDKSDQQFLCPQSLPLPVRNGISCQPRENMHQGCLPCDWPFLSSTFGYQAIDCAISPRRCDKARTVLLSTCLHDIGLVLGVPHCLDPAVKCLLLQFFCRLWHV